MEITHNKFRSLPYAVVDLAIEEKWVDKLSYFLHITSLTGNGIIYNYSCRSLADKMGIGKTTVHTNVSFLIEKGLMYICNKGHLKGISVKDMRSWYTNTTGKETGSGSIKIKIHDRVKHTQYNIYARVPLKNIGNQRYMADKRTEVNDIRGKIDSNKYVSKKEYETFKKFESTFKKKHTENVKSYSDRNTNFLSDKFLAKESKLSIDTIRVMMKFWVEQGILTSTLVKGTLVRDKTSALEYFHLKKERPDEFENTYLYKGLVLTYNRRAVGYGSSISKK